jgi:uncharacterized protein YbjT (DUF2867 family)
MILVTGAGGTVGSQVLNQLRAAGAKVRAAYHTPAKAEKARAQGIDAVVLDFADHASIRAALQGVDKLFLLGATSPNQSELEINVVQEAKQAGVKQIVKLSVLHAGKEEFTFARWHRAVEKAIEKSGVPFTFLRPTGFMQNFANYSGDMIRNQGAFYQPTDPKVSHVDVRDIAAVAVTALTTRGHEGKIYELTGPEALTNTQIADKLSRVTGRTVKFVKIPPEAARQGMLDMGMPEYYVDAVLDLQRFYDTGITQKVFPDVERVIGRKPHTFDDFARDHAQAFQPDARMTA